MLTKFSEVLHPLVGIELSKISLAGETICLGFGRLRESTRGRKGMVGEYSLHAQCDYSFFDQMGTAIDVSSAKSLVPLVVESVAVEQSEGVLVVKFTGGCRLEVQIGSDGEQLRFFKPDTDLDHAVFPPG